MTLDIKTSVIKPVRQTYANVAKRLGEDRPASRYEEGTFDLQSTENFHYRPTWDPDHQLYDQRRTAVKMADWYSYKDPRQFYYGLYTIARNKLMDACETSFAFVEKRDMIAAIDKEWLKKVQHYLLPLRHYEWGGNMNNANITHLGWGASVTQCVMYDCMDRLGIAQIISRIGLLMDGNSGEILNTTQESWLHMPMWQELRHMVEDSFVLSDWFEQLVAQNIVMDGIVYPLVYDRLDAEGLKYGATGISMICEFMRDWHADHMRWTDALIKTVVAESDSNRDLVSAWVKVWHARTMQAMKPLAEYVLGKSGAGALDDVSAGFVARLNKLGVAISI